MVLSGLDPTGMSVVSDGTTVVSTLTEVYAIVQCDWLWNCVCSDCTDSRREESGRSVSELPASDCDCSPHIAGGGSWW